MKHRSDPPLALDDNDRETILKHVSSWQCFTRDMVTALQVEDWIFSEADKELENLYELSEAGVDPNIAKEDQQSKINRYASMERLAILWNHYCVKSGRNSFSRGEVKRWFENIIK